MTAEDFDKKWNEALPLVDRGDGVLVVKRPPPAPEPEPKQTWTQAQHCAAQEMMREAFRKAGIPFPG